MNLLVLGLKMISEPQMPFATSPGPIAGMYVKPLPMYSQ